VPASKREHYLGHGVPDYWIVDPEERRVERWRPGADHAEIARDRLVWHPPRAAAPLVVELPPLFREAWGEET
jgi:hypothetical protein